MYVPISVVCCFSNCNITGFAPVHGAIVSNHDGFLVLFEALELFPDRRYLSRWKHIHRSEPIQLASTGAFDIQYGVQNSKARDLPIHSPGRYWK